MSNESRGNNTQVSSDILHTSIQKLYEYSAGIKTIDQKFNRNGKEAEEERTLSRRHFRGMNNNWAQCWRRGWENSWDKDKRIHHQRVPEFIGLVVL